MKTYKLKNIDCINEKKFLCDEDYCIHFQCDGKLQAHYIRKHGDLRGFENYRMGLLNAFRKNAIKLGKPESVEYWGNKFMVYLIARFSKKWNSKKGEKNG